MTPSAARQAVNLPSWDNVKLFLWGAVWSLESALTPCAVLLIHWSENWRDDPLDWGLFRKMGLACLISGMIKYWRKHRALLSPPPDSE